MRDLDAALQLLRETGDLLQTVQAEQATDDDDNGHTWTPIALHKLHEQPPEPPNIGPGLAYPGRRHVYSGEPETAKSWVALILSLLEIRRGEHAVYVDLEMGRRETLARMRALGAEDDELERFVYYEPHEPFTDSAQVAEVRDLVGDLLPSLVTLDAYTGALALHGLDPSSGVDIERLNRTLLDPFREHGAATIVLDHLPKDRERRGKFAIGSERKIGAADVHLGFETVHPMGRGRTGLVKVVTHKDRPGYLPRPRASEVELKSHPGGLLTWEIRPAEQDVAEAYDWRPTELMNRVLEQLHREQRPLTRGELVELVRGKREYVLQAVGFLVLDGKAVEETGGRGAKLLSLPRPVPTRSPPVPGTGQNDPFPVPPSPEGERVVASPTERQNGDPFPGTGNEDRDDESYPQADGGGRAALSETPTRALASPDPDDPEAGAGELEQARAWVVSEGWQLDDVAHELQRRYSTLTRAQVNVLVGLAVEIELDERGEIEP